ncbi:hypothetical protein [Massilia sp. TS11]|uniref:hypothetical protein n=1 Tax=Massilia sp. TS11 TaxID=2908003 RepID=UPI001EDC07C4|nr:hypothetical protein [Massilia sp. TS11]MCG2584515.1 hypothetical protein [Massilia sp. TS11]
MNGPASAVCQTVLADGRLAHVQATRRARAGRADVKASVAGQPGLAERLQQVVRLARHSEAQLELAHQVQLSIDPAPAAHDRDWELAAVLADRMVRGLYPSATTPLAQGWSTAWARARIEGHDLAIGGALLGGQLGHLGALNGAPDPGLAVASARAWFPLHSGGVHDSLAWVEVSVRPLAGGGEDGALLVAGLDLAAQDAVRETLLAARHFDGCAPGRWRSAVQFSETRFSGRSYELALVLADRLARGREFPPRGRLIASGCSQAWHTGRVDTVQASGPKCALIARCAEAGDRVLLPLDWQPEAETSLGPALRARGASLACISHIGLL